MSTQTLKPEFDSGDCSVESLLAEAKADPACLSALAGGGCVEKFERMFAASVGSHYALGVSSGTAALHVALLACDVAKGDEVIVSAYSWGQTVAAVLAVGAIPVFADIDIETGTIDVDAAGALLTPRTAAILATHIHGHPCEMKRLAELCTRHSVCLIADAAQALGAMIDGKSIGAWGDIACFSLGRGKAVTSGEGGVAACNSFLLYQKMLLVSQHPIRSLREVEDFDLRDSVTEFCLNYRMTPLAAAIALAQLYAVSEQLEKRRRGIGRFIEGVQSNTRWRVARLPIGARWSGYRVVLRYTGGVTAADRDEVASQLQEAGVLASSAPVPAPLYARPPFCVAEDIWYPRAMRPIRSDPSWRAGSCPNAERRCYVEDVVILPEAGWLAATAEQIDQLVQAVVHTLAEGSRL